MFQWLNHSNYFLFIKTCTITCLLKLRLLSVVKTYSYCMCDDTYFKIPFHQWSNQDNNLNSIQQIHTRCHVKCNVPNNGKCYKAIVEFRPARLAVGSNTYLYGQSTRDQLITYCSAKVSPSRDSPNKIKLTLFLNLNMVGLIPWH